MESLSFVIKNSIIYEYKIAATINGVSLNTDKIKKRLGYIDITFLRFACVGTLNTIFGYSMFTMFIMTGLHYQFAVILGTIISILFNFKTIGHLVFKNPSNRLVLKFLLVYLFIAVLNIMLLDIELKMKINIYMAGAILLVPLGMLSFILNKTIVFRKR